jgi:hypothetical protein
MASDGTEFKQPAVQTDAPKKSPGFYPTLVCLWITCLLVSAGALYLVREMGVPNFAFAFVVFGIVAVWIAGSAFVASRMIYRADDAQRY